MYDDFKRSTSGSVQLTPDYEGLVRCEILRVVSDTKTPVVLEIPPRTGVAVIFDAGEESGRWIPLRALLG